MSAPSLSTLQRWMKRRIQPGTPSDEEGLSSVLNPQGGEPGWRRLAVYAQGYDARVHDALAEVYEAIRHVIGARAFMELARGYAERCRSHEANLSMVGRHLPAFLSTSSWQERLPFLRDLATLEWRVQEAFHARERTPLHPATLSAMAPEAWAQLRFMFQPSVSLVDSAWPIVSIWEARTQPREAIAIPLHGRPQCALVFRHGFSVRCEAVSPAQRLLLSGLLAGRSLGAVCAELAGTAGHHPQQLTEWFLAWTEAGLIAGHTGGET